jgi:hypothetical protein
VAFSSQLSSPKAAVEERPYACNTSDEDEEIWEDDTEEQPEYDNAPIDNSSDEVDEESKKPGHFIFPPSIEEVQKALTDLSNLLKPRRKKGCGFRDPGLDKITTERLSAMKLFCFNFVNMQTRHPNSPQWQAASLQTAKSLGYGKYRARILREWMR